MATAKETTKVTAGEIVSATRQYSNKDDANRKFNITADVSIKNGKVINFNNGSLIVLDVPATGSANFSQGEGWLSFNTNNLTDEEVKEAFDATLVFMNDVRNNVDSLPIE